MNGNMEEHKRESEKVTLAGLTARLSVRTGDTKRQTEDFLRELFALIAGELEKGESVKVPGLGVVQEHRGRGPQERERQHRRGDVDTWSPQDSLHCVQRAVCDSERAIQYVSDH